MWYRRQQQQISADCYGNVAIFPADVLNCEFMGLGGTDPKFNGVSWYEIFCLILATLAIWRFCFKSQPVNQSNITECEAERTT